MCSNFSYVNPSSVPFYFLMREGLCLFLFLATVVSNDLILCKKKESILVLKEKYLKIGLRFLMVLAETQFPTISELLWG